MSIPLFIIFMVLFSTSNSQLYIDCNGKGFYCKNSTSFLICVDTGNGATQTIDDLIQTCPTGTFCNNNAPFECMEAVSNNFQIAAGTENSNINHTKMTNHQILSDDFNEAMPTLEMINNIDNRSINLTANNQLPTINTTANASNVAIPINYNFENHPVTSFYPNQNASTENLGLNNSATNISEDINKIVRNSSNVPQYNFERNSINSFYENQNLFPTTYNLGSNNSKTNLSADTYETPSNLSNSPQYNFDNNLIHNFYNNNLVPITHNLGSENIIHQSTNAIATALDTPNLPYNFENHTVDSLYQNQNIIPYSENLEFKNSTTNTVSNIVNTPQYINSDSFTNNYQLSNHTQDNLLPDEKVIILPSSFGLPTNYSKMNIDANLSKEYAESERLPNTINSIAEFGGVDYNQTVPNFGVKHFSYKINNYTSPEIDDETNSKIYANASDEYNSTIINTPINQTGGQLNSYENITDVFNNGEFALVPQTPNNLFAVQNTTSLYSEHLEIVPLKDSKVSLPNINESFNSDHRQELFTANAQDLVVDTPYVPPIHIGTTEEMQHNGTDYNTFSNYTIPSSESGAKFNGSDYKPETDKTNYNITLINTNIKPNETFKSHPFIEEQLNVMSMLSNKNNSDIKQLQIDYSFPNITSEDIINQILKSTFKENDNNQTQPNTTTLNLNETRLPTNSSDYRNSMKFDQIIPETKMNETENTLPALTIAFNNDEYISGSKIFSKEGVSTAPQINQNTLEAGNKLKEALSIFTNALNDLPQASPDSKNAFYSTNGPNHTIFAVGDNKIESNNSFLLPHLQSGEPIMIPPLYETGDLNKRPGLINPIISETIQKPHEPENSLSNRNNVIPLSNTPAYYSNQQVNPPINYDLRNYQGYGYRIPNNQQVKENIPVINNYQKQINNNPGVVECHIYESSPDPSTCHSYYVCRNNQPVRLFCPYNTIYSPLLRTCTTDKDHCSNGREFVCTSPGFHPDPKSCYSYYECQLSLNGYKVNKYFCPWYSSYNPQHKQCVEGDSNCHNWFNNQRTITHTPNNVGPITQTTNQQLQQTPRAVVERYEDKIQQTVPRPFQNMHNPMPQPTQRQAGTSWAPNRLYWF